MFVRKKRNKSGSTSIKIITKKDGIYQVVKTLGTSQDLDEIERLYRAGQKIIHARPEKQLPLFVTQSEHDQIVENAFEALSNASVRTVGPELIFGKLFDEMRFNEIKNTLFRHITIARLAYPASKLKTVDYLYRYLGIDISEDKIYRFLDELNKTYKEKVEKIAYQNTKKHLGGTISVVFYDMTTLYFEAEDEDDLRKIGFSKDGKFQCPQIMLGLLVGKNGYPIGYDIFEGNTFEGHTLIPILEKIQKKYTFGRPTVIADSAMLSMENLKNLNKAKYRFIIGGRLKNENEIMKEKILELAKDMKDGRELSLQRPDGTRLIVTYSKKRAKKDAYNRERGLRKLQKRMKMGRLTKEHINNRGYNRFLTLDGRITVSIDYNKVNLDSGWDGLKGYITNTRLSTKTVVENYGHLWQIEQAFRISKTDLRIRPIFHYRKKRIEAHICIAFVAYAIYRELERLLKKNKVPMSPRRAAELTHTMYALEFILPDANEIKKKILKMDSEQQILYQAVYP